LRDPARFAVVAALAICALTASFILADKYLLSSSDSDVHHLNCQVYARVMALGDPGDLQDWVEHTNPSWPPLTHLYHGALGWLISDSPEAIRLYSLPLLLLLLWCVFQLGTRLGDRSTGALAVVLTGFSVGIASQARHVSLDLPATVVVWLALVNLVECGRRRGPWPVLFFGAACGVAMLTRIQALFFLWLPAALVFGLRLWEAPGWRARGRLLLALGSALALVVLISSFHWYGRLVPFIAVATTHTDPSAVSSLGDPGFFPGLRYYAVVLGRVAGWPVLAAALALAPVLWRRQRRAALMLLGVVLGGVLLFAATVSREERYLLPAVPAVCLFAALGLRQLVARVARPAGAALMVGAVLPTLLLADPDIGGMPGEWQPVAPRMVRAPSDHANRARLKILAWSEARVRRAVATKRWPNFLLFEGFGDSLMASEMIHRLQGVPVNIASHEEAFKSRFVQKRARTHGLLVLNGTERGANKAEATLQLKIEAMDLVPSGQVHFYTLPPGWVDGFLNQYDEGD